MAPKKLFKIGEIMRYTGLSRQTLHNYTTMGLISEEERTESGHRLYPEKVFKILKKIEMYKRHRTLKEVRELLEEKFGKNNNGKDEVEEEEEVVDLKRQ